MFFVKESISSYFHNPEYFWQDGPCDKWCYGKIKNSKIKVCWRYFANGTYPLHGRLWLFRNQGTFEILNEQLNHLSNNNKLLLLRLIQIAKQVKGIPIRNNPFARDAQNGVINELKTLSKKCKDFK